jgi:hypothetical protein
MGQQQGADRGEPAGDGDVHRGPHFPARTVMAWL